MISTALAATSTYTHRGDSLAAAKGARVTVPLVPILRREREREREKVPNLFAAQQIARKI